MEHDNASPAVTSHRHGRVWVITVNNPPVNALSWHVRQGLEDNFGAALADEVSIEAEYVVIATPTNYDSATHTFNTRSVEAVIANVLAMTVDPTQGQRYQGIVPLEGASLAAACEQYFYQSEQVPTLLKVGVKVSDGRCVAGGVLLQYLPHGEVGRERLHARL